MSLKKFFGDNSVGRFALFLYLLILLKFVALFLDWENNQEIIYQYALVFLIHHIIAGALVHNKTFGYLQMMKIFQKKSHAYNSIISLSIVYLVVHPVGGNFYEVISFNLLLMLVYVLTRGLIRQSNHSLPVFNSAALAIVVTYLISYYLSRLGIIYNSSLFISWWGADLSVIPINLFKGAYSELISFIGAVLGLGVVYWFAKKFNKVKYGSVFVLTWFFGTTVVWIMRGGTLDLQFMQLMSNQLVDFVGFYTFVMLIEPKTSPSKKKAQVVLGFVAGLIFVTFETFLHFSIISNFPPFSELYQLWTILIMNVIVILSRGKF